MRIAVVGSGIAGLAASYWLSRQHDVELYEAAATLGGHAHTVDLEHRGETLAIDTGFMVFNEWTYPNFCALLRELGVASEPTSMSFSVRSDNERLEYNGTSFNGLFAQRKNLWNRRYWRMLRDVLRFNRQCHAGLSAAENEMTVAEFLRHGGYSEEFAAWYLLPMGSAIWSCPAGVFAQFPIRFIREFYDNHGLLNLVRRPTWRIITGGSRTYVEALRQRMEARVFLNHPVRSVHRSDEDVRLVLANGECERFDHVVLACHSDQALRLLAEPTGAEREILSAFRYEESVVQLHTDTSLLPRSRRAWASWNYWIPESSAAAEYAPAARLTYELNRLQNLGSRQTFCISLNSTPWIDPKLVLKTFHYAHPVYTLQRDKAQARHHELLGPNRTSYAGAYWRNGFHEDGVVSALAVCQALNQSASLTPAKNPSATRLAHAQ